MQKNEVKNSQHMNCNAKKIGRSRKASSCFFFLGILKNLIENKRSKEPDSEKTVNTIKKHDVTWYENDNYS